MGDATTSDWQLVLLDQARDSARVLSCAERTPDYVQMESGRLPDALWVQGFFNDAPPGRTSEDILLMGIELPDESLAGLVGLSPGYEGPGEWYIGLLLIADGHRNSGLGSAVFAQIKALAAKSGANSLKLAVFKANDGALRFWERHGFAPFGADTADAQDRIVLMSKINC